MSQVHRLCLGTASFGMAYPPGSRSPRPTHAECAEMLRYADDHGIEWIDTGEAYGDAEALVLAYSDSRYLVTKSAPDLHCHHSLYRWSYVLLHNPTCDELAGLRPPAPEWMGASVYTPEEAHAAIAAGLKILQVPYHVLDQRHAPTMVAAHQVGVTVMARQPFARGEALRRGYSVADCLRFALMSPADLIVFGVSSLAQLREVVAVAEAYEPIGHVFYQELLSADIGLNLASVCTPRR